MRIKHWPKNFLLICLCCVCQTAISLPLNSLSMKGVLGGQTSAHDTQFKQALKPRIFDFPRDHLAHQFYKTEWWYLSGNVVSHSINKTETSCKFAYQFTLFRFALLPEKVSMENSKWRSGNIYMAHIALTDISNQKVYHQERFSRDALMLAGAGKDEKGLIKFWLNDWQLKSVFAEQLFPLTLAIKDDNFSLSLQIEPVKPLVLQGNKGLSQKSSRHASFYYSYTRLASKGKLTIENNEFDVSGNSWFDREWSTSSLGEEQIGWDWFALHLDDGSDLMIYQMRKKGGAKDRYSSGILVDSQGKSEMLQAQQFQLRATQFWQSPVSGIRYPVSWTILIPEKNIKLMVSTPVKQQEWSKAGGFSFNYWEGSVEVNGIINQQPASGSGYLEMTGYD